MSQQPAPIPTRRPIDQLREPRALAEEAEHAALPEGREERFVGWGVMGVTFSSGDVLAMRRFPVTSLGHGYSSVWHRDASGAWTIWADRPPQESCARYFSSALAHAETTSIDISWKGPRSFRVRVPSASLSWDVELGSNGATKTMNAMSRAMPDKAWRSASVLRAMARLAGPMLQVGHVGLSGRVPNGQTFIANPMKIWFVEHTAATLDGRYFGAPAPLPTQTKLGDFWIPQRGLFVIGRSFFEPTAS